MANPTQDELYAVEIYGHLLSGFSPDNEDRKWDLNNIDATAWFTGLAKACALVFNELTDDDKNAIEWTHIAQNLLIQSMMQKKDAA
jgi:hypothetical protein